MSKIPNQPENAEAFITTQSEFLNEPPAGAVIAYRYEASICGKTYAGWMGLPSLHRHRFEIGKRHLFRQVHGETGGAVSYERMESDNRIEWAEGIRIRSEGEQRLVTSAGTFTEVFFAEGDPEGGIPTVGVYKRSRTFCVRQDEFLVITDLRGAIQFCEMVCRDFGVSLCDFGVTELLFQDILSAIDRGSFAVQPTARSEYIEEWRNGGEATDGLLIDPTGGLWLQTAGTFTKATLADALRWKIRGEVRGDEGLGDSGLSAKFFGMILVALAAPPKDSQRN